MCTRLLCETLPNGTINISVVYRQKISVTVTNKTIQNLTYGLWPSRPPGPNASCPFVNGKIPTARPTIMYRIISHWAPETRQDRLVFADADVINYNL